MRYRVHIPIITQQTHRVEADSPEEAIKLVADGQGEFEFGAEIELAASLPLDQWRAEPFSDDAPTPPVPALKVWVLLVEDDTYGRSSSVHRSKEHAWHSLDQYVRDCWKERVGEELSAADRDERIQVYFDTIKDQAFHIQESELLGPESCPLDPSRAVIETQDEQRRWKP